MESSLKTGHNHSDKNVGVDSPLSTPHNSHASGGNSLGGNSVANQGKIPEKRPSSPLITPSASASRPVPKPSQVRAPLNDASVGAPYKKNTNEQDKFGSSKIVVSDKKGANSQPEKNSEKRHERHAEKNHYSSDNFTLDFAADLISDNHKSKSGKIDKTEKGDKGNKIDKSSKNNHDAKKLTDKKSDKKGDEKPTL